MKKPIECNVGNIVEFKDTKGELAVGTITRIMRPFGNIRYFVETSTASNVKISPMSVTRVLQGDVC